MRKRVVAELGNDVTEILATSMLFSFDFLIRCLCSINVYLKLLQLNLYWCRVGVVVYVSTVNPC